VKGISEEALGVLKVGGWREGMEERGRGGRAGGRMRREHVVGGTMG